MRKSLAQQALASWCEARELVCTGKFTRLSMGGATLENLMVSGQGQTALKAPEIGVKLGWPGLFKPRLEAVSAVSPVVHGVLSDGRLSFYGLESLVKGGAGGAGAMPDFGIRDGRILIGTSAGEIGASFAVSGPLPREGRLTLTVDPARLDTPQGAIEWSEGVIDVVAEDGQLQGDITLALESLESDDVSISQAHLSAVFDSGTVADAPVSLVWDGEVATARAAGYALDSVTTSGRAAAGQLSSASVEDFLRSLTVLDLQLLTGSVAGQGQSASSISLETSLKGSGGLFEGPLALSIEDAEIGQGGARRLEAEGVVRRDESGRLEFSGPVSLAAAHVSDASRKKLLASVELPAPLSAHGESLKAALSRALDGVDAVLDARLRKEGSAYTVSFLSATRMQAVSGLAVSVEPSARADWLRFGREGLSLAGNVAISGGGVPQARLALDAFDHTGDGFRLSAHDISVRPWTASGATFGADLPALTIEGGPDSFAAASHGRITVSGKVFGFQLGASALSGGLRAARSDKGWQVLPENTNCLRFETDGVGIGAIDFQRNSFDLCPQGGAYIKPGRATPGGRLVLGDLSLPFSAKSVSGTVFLPDATLDWTSQGGLAFSLDAPTLSLPMQVGERTLGIDAAAPTMGFASRKGATPHLTAALGGTVFTGTLVPARVSAERISFDGTSNSGGLSGDIAGTGVLVEDFREDPMYQPLAADLTATLDQGQLIARGPFRLKANDVPIGDFALDVNVMRLDGTARVTTHPLDFRKGALQPVMLSERLRGVYTDAIGRIEAKSDVTITGGKLDGTANVTVSGFGFQTTRLGRVESVNGHVAFSDLFALETEPAQVLTIGGLNPGIPLRNGQITFDYAYETGLDVGSASFPFSGGVLALAPFQWVPRAETQHLEVTADAIDLAELVRIMKLPKIEAEGTVSGSFPIEFVGTKVLIRDAHLFADASGGRVAYLGDAADAAAQSNANVRMAFEALKDFDFTVLEVGLDGNVADRVTITLKLAGKSRKDITYGNSAQIVRGQPFEFNIAIDSALAELFRSSQFYTNQQKITDFVVKEVLTERGLAPQEDE
ncbi:MAG: YdbH domain-containing protein [Hyphomonas sp.]